MGLKSVSLALYVATVACFAGSIVRLYGQITVIPPSPQATAFFRHQEYPVDPSTGLPSINVSLYTINSGTLKLPLSAEYHSSGRRVYDDSGELGLGWTLNAGGRVSRTVFGEADDNDAYVGFPVPWRSRSSISLPNDVDFLAGIEDPFFTHTGGTQYDTEYDIFSYRVNSFSGKFVLKDSLNFKIPLFLPKKAHKVNFEKFTSPQQNYFTSVTMIDEHGSEYKFGPVSENSSQNIAGYSPKTSWLLHTIISANRQDTISFVYQSVSKSRRVVTQRLSVVDNVVYTYPEDYSAIPVDPTYSDRTEHTSEEFYVVQVVKEIHFSGGRVIFNRAANSDRISSMQVLSSSGTVLKKIEFTQVQHDIVSDGNSTRHKLSNILFKGSDNAVIDKYSFDYYPTFYPSGNTTLNVRFSDYWGYYNASGNACMVPQYNNLQFHGLMGVQFVTVGCGNLMPSLTAMRSGVLKSITFPAGAVVEFTYELNRYWNPVVGSAMNGGGLRLAQTTTTESGGLAPTYITYRYGTGESGHGIIPLVPELANRMQTLQHIHYYPGPQNGGMIQVSYRQRILTSGFSPIFSYVSSKPIVYPEVTEYQGTVSLNTGKTVYRYDLGNFTTVSNIDILSQTRDYNYWAENSLISETQFRNEGAGNYVQVSRLDYIYTTTSHSSEKVWGLHVRRNYRTYPDYLTNTNIGNLPSYRYAVLGPQQYPVFEYGDYGLLVGKKSLTKKTETLFTPSGENVTVTEYEYNSRHLVDNVKVTNSKQQSIVTTYKYPFDFPASPVYLEMNQRNMVSSVVEEIETVSGVQAMLKRTNYGVFNANKLHLPASIQIQRGGFPIDTAIRFTNYDVKGNLVEQQPPNGVKQAYQWGYNHQHPVALVRNAGDSRWTQVSNGTGQQAVNWQPGNVGTRTISFVVTVAGNVTIQIGWSGNPGSNGYSNIQYNLSGPTVRSGQICIRASTNSSNSCPIGSSSITLSNIQPGSYSLVVYPVTNTSIAVLNLSCSYPAGGIVQNGTKEFFHENFEENGTVGLAHTGTRYKQGDYIVSFTPPNGRSYVISYWYRSGGTWLYSGQLPYIGPNQNLTLGDAIDDVRIHPKEAQMETFTYDPLVGMTSHTDASGNVHYYEYDSFGRLKAIRNLQGHLVEDYQYHYRP